LQELEKRLAADHSELPGVDPEESEEKKPLDATLEMKRQKLEKLNRMQQELEKLLSDDNPEPEAGNPEESEKKQAADGELKKKMHELEELNRKLQAADGDLGKKRQALEELNRKQQELQELLDGDVHGLSDENSGEPAESSGRSDGSGDEPDKKIEIEQKECA